MTGERVHWDPHPVAADLARRMPWGSDRLRDALEVASAADLSIEDATSLIEAAARIGARHPGYLINAFIQGP